MHELHPRYSIAVTVYPTVVLDPVRYITVRINKPSQTFPYSSACFTFHLPAAQQNLLYITRLKTPTNLHTCIVNSRGLMLKTRFGEGGCCRGGGCPSPDAPPASALRASGLTGNDSTGFTLKTRRNVPVRWNFGIVKKYTPFLSNGTSDQLSSTCSCHQQIMNDTGVGRTIFFSSNVGEPFYGMTEPNRRSLSIGRCECSKTKPWCPMKAMIHHQHPMQIMHHIISIAKGTQVIRYQQAQGTPAIHRYPHLLMTSPDFVIDINALLLGHR